MDELQEPADHWLAAELNRIWLVAERALRALQKAQIRPQPGHPSIAEVEGILAARRVARLGPKAGTKPEEADALEKAIKAAEAELGPARSAAPIAKLIANLGLRPLEVETLVSTMAPHVDAPLSQLFTVLRGPGNQRHGVDLALLAQMFRLRRADRLAMLDAVDPDRPLLRWGLIQVISAESVQSFGSMTHRAIRPTFQLVSMLCRAGQLDPALTRCTSIVQAEPTLDDLLFDDAMRAKVVSICESAAEAAKSREKTSAYPRLLLWGAGGAGKKTIAAKVAAYAGKPLITFDTTALDAGTFVEVFQRVQCAALVRDAVLFVGPLIDQLQKDGARELTRRLVGYNGMVAIGVDTLQPPMVIADHPIQEIHVEIPSEQTRLRLWETSLPEQTRDESVRLPPLATGFKLTPGEITSIAQESLAIAKGEKGRRVTHAVLRTGVERRMRNNLSEMARRLTITVKWEDLVLPAQDMARVQEFISRKKNKETVYERWGFGPRVGYGKGLIALFSGPPGTGKTMLAQLIAKALDLDLYQVDLAQVLSKWVGETEKQLAKVFDQAERAHAVLLFDEADSLFAKRTEVRTSNDRYANLVVNYLLQRLEQYDGVAVLTTNKEAQLDEALQRRLTMHLHLEIPDIPERERLWRTFLPPEAPIEEHIDLSQLAQGFELSGGYIKNAAVRAAFLAAARDVPIGISLLELASGLELEDMGRVVVREHDITPEDIAPPDVSFDFTDA